MDCNLGGATLRDLCQLVWPTVCSWHDLRVLSRHRALQVPTPTSCRGEQGRCDRQRCATSRPNWVQYLGISARDRLRIAASFRLPGAGALNHHAPLADRGLPQLGMLISANVLEKGMHASP